MSKRVGVIQSSYIPWKGYFDFVDTVDEFVIFDDVQYVRRDWRNRNLIKTKDGKKWLTIAVESKGNYDAPIDAIRIADPKWIDEHLATLKHVYRRAPHFDEIWPWLENVYEGLRSEALLTSVNERLIRAICDRLNITTPIRRSRELGPPPGKNERLIFICQQLAATEYVSGPAAQSYIDEAVWEEAGIKVRYKSYAGYPEYPQAFPPFDHGVSVVDVLFNCGPAARQAIKSEKDVE